MKSGQSEEKRREGGSWLRLAVATAIGVGVGVVTDSMGIGIAVGLVLGIILTADERRRAKSERDEP